MKKLRICTAAAAIIIILSGIFFFERQNSTIVKSTNGEYIIALNRIEHLCAAGDAAEAGEASRELMLLMQESNSPAEKDYSAFYFAGAALLFLFGISAYCGHYIIKPFESLTDLADRVAAGELDIPLKYQRENYFGKFTWAFDNMRRELIRSRAAEKAAMENNKTIIASLSHDIKTPVASIRAYAEGLEAGMDTNAEKRAKYLEVIMRKCDDITRITNDMLLHSLSDMDRLTIAPRRFEPGELAERVIGEISADSSDIRFERPQADINVSADPDRIGQIIENLINNSRKYAGTEIDISLKKSDDFAELCFRDYGSGIDDRDLPFVFDKFYRGHNSTGKQGSGLGLYIVKYIAEGSGGEVIAKNLPDGFSVTLRLPLADLTFNDNLMKK